MADDEVRFTMRLDPETDNEWDEFQEEHPGFSSKSELVRRSVTEFIQREQDKEDGELTKEQREVISVIRQENARILNLAEEIKEVADAMDESQISPSQHRELSFEAVEEANKNQTDSLINQLSDSKKGDTDE
jgi:metal-responsive CopG/Arc/MetJ family transcriptional regulator